MAEILQWRSNSGKASRMYNVWFDILENQSNLSHTALNYFGKRLVINFFWKSKWICKSISSLRNKKRGCCYDYVTSYSGDNLQLIYALTNLEVNCKFDLFDIECRRDIKANRRSGF